MAEGSTVFYCSTHPTASTSTSSMPSPSSQGNSATAGTEGRPSTGKGSRGPRPRLFGRAQCQADNCVADLSGLPRYHLRNHICHNHKTAESFFKQGSEVRFCQRCGVAHPLAEYDGLKKSCRRMLALHNSRRRKTGAPAPAPAAAASGNAVAAAEHPNPQLQAAVAAQLLPALAGMQLGAELVQPVNPESSPAASVGSAAALSDASGGWLLPDSSGGGGSTTDGILLPDLPPPYRKEAPWQAQPAAAPTASPAGAEAPLSAAATGTAAHEWVCCGNASGTGASCCGGARATAGDVPAAAAAATTAAAGGAGALVGYAASRAGTAAGSRLVNGAIMALSPAGAAAAAAAPGGAGGAAEPVGGAAADTADSGAQPASVSCRGGAARDAAAPAPAGNSISAEATAALARLRQQNMALYQLFVQQQVLAAHTLLATAGIVFSQRLPLAQPSTISSTVSAR